jgi:hypothetical protein
MLRAGFVMRSAPFLLALSLVVLAPRRARAGNDDELLAGNEAAMMGGAVSAFVADASAAWYNPAGLGAITRSQIDVSGTVYTLRFSSTPKFIELTTGESEDASVSEFVSIPTQIAYGRLLVPGVTLGLGYFVPQATSIVLREQLVAGDTEDRSEWQVAIASARVLHNGVLALGFSLLESLRLGVSLIGSYEAESQSAVVFGAISGQNGLDRLIQFTSLGTGNRIAFELGTGLQMDLSPRVAIGLTVRSPRLQIANSRDFVFTRGAGLSPDADGPLLEGGLDNSVAPEQVALLRAGRFGASVTYSYGTRSRVCLEADAQPALHDTSQDIARRAVLNARIGVLHALSPSLALGFGLFTDRSAYTLSGDPGNGEGHFYGGTLGLELSNEHLLAESEPVDSLIFRTVFALRYAFMPGNMDGFLVDPEGPLGDEAVAHRNPLYAHELGLYVGGGLAF